MVFCPKCGAENMDGSKFCIKCGAPLKAKASNTIKSNVSVSDTIYVNDDVQTIRSKLMRYFNSINAAIETDQGNRIVVSQGSKLIKPYTSGWAGIWLSKSTSLPKRITIELEELDNATKVTIQLDENYRFGKQGWLLDPLSKMKYKKALEKMLAEIKDAISKP
ncbi:zinc-ribbon domain-containing protein [Archaeoglobus sp.]